MERRDILVGGFSSAAMLIGTNSLFAQDSGVNDSGDELVNFEFNGEKITSYNKITSEAEELGEKGVKRFRLGRLARGLHVSDIAIPRGTRLVLGQVQEGINIGDAVYATLGIAIKPTASGEYHCRVFWSMSWVTPHRLPAIFTYITF